MALKALVRGGGDLASGAAFRLFRAGIQVVVTELAQPMAVRLRVSFAEAVYSGDIEIEGIQSRLAESSKDVFRLLKRGYLPVIVDPNCDILVDFQPQILVDGRMLKKAPEMDISVARLVVGLGPGFIAGNNCHAVVETRRGPFMGRVYYNGSAEEDTGMPEKVGPYQVERVLRAPVNGIFNPDVEIGAIVDQGQTVGSVKDTPVIAHFKGLVRGMLHAGLEIRAGTKVGDLDPRLDPRLCSLVSDKSLAVGGGVLEAVLANPGIRSKI